MNIQAGNIDQDFFQLNLLAEKSGVLSAMTQPRHSRAERLAAGAALRGTVPRRSHADYQPAPDRMNPVDRIEAQNALLVQKLVGVRMSRMSATPFTFLRGTAAVMAADLAGTPASGLEVMACGDMHLANFGLFATAERNLVFAINDFDEVHPGAWEWDLKRLAASAAVAARFAGGDKARAEGAAHAVVRSYVQQMQRYSKMGFLETWYELIDEQQILRVTPRGMTKNTLASMAKARTKDRHKVYGKKTEIVDGLRRITEAPPLVVRETHADDGTPALEALEAMLRSYVTSLPVDRRRLLSRYRLVDVARKVVGVGSVGTSCWILLLEGMDAQDPLILQVKQARASVLAPYGSAPLSLTTHGHRVVAGQRMIQGSPDIFLGWGGGGRGVKSRHFYVRQLADMKGGREFVEGDHTTLDGLESYSWLCGWALALAHAKSGDAAMIAGYCGRSDALPDAIAKFAMAYSKQTDRDHSDMVAAIREGRLPIEPQAPTAD